MLYISFGHVFMADSFKMFFISVAFSCLNCVMHEIYNSGITVSFTETKIKN